MSVFSSALGRMWRGHRTEEQTPGPSPPEDLPQRAFDPGGPVRRRRVWRSSSVQGSLGTARANRNQEGGEGPFPSPPTPTARPTVA